MAFGLYMLDWVPAWTFEYLAPSPISAILVALWNGNPTPDLLSGAEIAGNNYSRVTVNIGGFARVNVHKYQNVQVITFPECQNNDWGTVDYVVLADSVGNCLYYGALAAAKTIKVGDFPRFDIGDLEVIMY